MPEPAHYLPLTTSAERALAQLRALAPEEHLLGLDAERLIGERAALGLYSLGRSVSAGGACRLLKTRDGLIALNLPRDDDWTLLPAWLECGTDTMPTPTWARLAEFCADRTADNLVSRARLIGLAAARADLMPRAPSYWRTTQIIGTPATPRVRPRVLDLSVLWAGPLCAHLLERAGAEVIKVEAPHRPDGARAGNSNFYGLLNQNKRCVTLDLRDRDERRLLLDLIAGADIVIESARPRFLKQFGIEAAALVANRPALSWIAISGYGRNEPEANWIGYGDDAGAAGGLCAILARAIGYPGFVGDAIADPLTGIHAACAAIESWRAGGGRLVSLALADVAAHCIAEERAWRGPSLESALNRWHGAARRGDWPSQPPRRVEGPVAAPGAHNRELLSMTVPC